MELAPDFDEFIACLSARGVEFLVVGAYALAFHGAPRFTGDLDILIRPTAENAQRLLQAIGDFGFPSDAVSADELSDPRRMLEMGVPPVQLHIMSALSGLSWDDAQADAAVGRIGSHTVGILGRASLIRNKRAAGRPKDLADLDALGEGGD
ncbi:MAG: hypothetical protein JSU08_13385 [Acidobacteria bacterium]|nr:hypothetical protein [Acidobacteriota bacterium]